MNFTRLKKELLYLWFLIPVIGLLCLRNYAYYWDSISYANHIENSPLKYTFHKHHLIFTPINSLIHTFLSRLGVAISGIDILVLTGIIFGIIYLIVCYLIFRRIFTDFPLAAPLGTLLIGISYTFGTFIQNGSPYMMPMSLCALIGLRIVWQSRKSGRIHVNSWDWILLFLAVCVHQIALLLLPAIIFAQMMAVNEYRSRTIIRNILVFFFSLLSIYLLVFYLTNSHPTSGGFINWVAGYAKSNFWVFNEVDGFLPAVQKSLIESLYSSKALFIAPVDRNVLRIHDFQMVFGNPVFFKAASWVLFAVIVTFVIYGIRRMSVSRTKKNVFLFFIIWMIPYMLLFQVFTPYQSFYRMFYLLPLMIFFMEGVRETKWSKVMLACGVFLFACFLSSNFIRGFIPESNPQNNPYLMYAKEVAKTTNDRDLFLMSMYPDYNYGNYLRYFGKRDVCWVRHFPIEDYPEATFEKLWSLSRKTQIEIQNSYDSIYLSTDTVMPSSGCIRLIPNAGGTLHDEVLLLMPQQLRLSEFSRLGGKYFCELKLVDYKPTLAVPLGNDLP